MRAIQKKVIFLKHQMIADGIPDFFLLDNGLQFFSTFFVFMFFSIEVWNKAKMAYDIQTIL